MKIALVVPKTPYKEKTVGRDFTRLTYMGILSIASYLNQEGYIFDLRSENENIISKLKEYEVVGFYSAVDNYKSLEELIPKVKRERKDIVTIVSGHLISSYGLSINNLIMQSIKDIDIGVIGAGESVLLDIVQNLNKKKLESIDGAIIRKDEKLIVGKQRKDKNLIKDIVIDHSLWPNLKSILEENNNWTPIYFSKGCPYGCDFCFNYDKNIKRKSLANFEKELILLNNNFGKLNFCLYDENFTLGKKDETLKVAELLGNYSANWDFMTRVSDVNDETLKSFNENKCRLIMYGAESFSDEILKRVNKNLTSEQIIKVLRKTKNKGITPWAFFIVGLPGENKASIENTIKIIEKEDYLIPRRGVLQVYPGTKLYFEAKNKGLIKDEINFLKSYYGDEDTAHKFGPIMNLSDLKDEELYHYCNIIEDIRRDRELAL